MKNSKLKEIRQALGLNQKAFADELGIQQSYYSALELGKKDISTSKVLQLLFDKIGVRPEWFYNSNGDIFDSSNVDNKRGKSGVNYIKNQKYYNSLKGENKAIYDTYRLLERLSYGNLQSSDIQQLAIDEAAKHEDKTLYYYLLSSKELNNTRADLNDIKSITLDIGIDLVETYKIYRDHFDSVVNEEIQSTDYETFKNKRFGNLEKLLIYKDSLKSLQVALSNFNKQFAKLQKNDTKKGKK